jgi:hypothetical protein
MTDTELAGSRAGSRAGALAGVRMDGELPARADLGLIFNELDFQLATQAYLWALPLVSFAQWQAQHRDVFGATSYDLVHYATYQDKLGILTANATTPYTMAFIDLNKTGPVMIELPAGPTAGGLSDFWQREFGMLGEMGPDQGRGGRHLIVPPGQQATPPDGCYAYQSTGMNVFFGFRTLDPDPKRAQALSRAVRITPVDGRAAPATRIVSPMGRRWSGGPPRGIEYWARLHDIYQHEIVDERDRFYLAMLRQLGIEKGRPFTPGERLTAILTQASATGELMAQANSFAKRFDGSRYWLDRQWDLVVPMSNSAQRRAPRAHLVVLRGGDVLRGDEEPDAGQGAGVPVRLHRRQRQLARRRRQLHPARPGRPPGQAVLVGHGLRRGLPLPHRQRPAARRPRIPPRRPAARGRRLRQPLLRPQRPGRPRVQLGADHPRPALVLLRPLLRPARAVLRPVLETRRHPPGYLAGTAATQARLASSGLGQMRIRADSCRPKCAFGACGLVRACWSAQYQTVSSPAWGGAMISMVGK